MSGVGIQGSLFDISDKDYYQLSVTEQQEVSVSLSTTSRRYPTIPSINMKIDVSIFNANQVKVGGFTSEVSAEVNTKLIAGPGTVVIEVSTSDRSNFEGSIQYSLKADFQQTFAPDIALSTQSLTFSDVEITTSKELTLKVSNQGNQSLNVSEISSGDARAFAVSPTTFTLAPGSSQEIKVTFIPTSTGENSATLTIKSDDPDEGTLSISLSGKGIEPPRSEIAISTNLLAFGDVVKVGSIGEGSPGE